MTTITADPGGKNYVLGRGKVYFDRYLSNDNITADTVGEGQRYLGNTPTFSTSSASTDLDHYSSEGGVKVKDDSVQLTLDRTGKFTCDNIDLDNVALYFIGESDPQTQASAASVVFVVTIKQGYYYQMGSSASLPFGHKNLGAMTTVKTGVGFATVVAASDANYQVDSLSGRVFIPVGSVIADDTPVQFTYAVLATTYDQVVSSSDSIYGAITFISDNPKGPNRDYLMPYVKLSPDGDYDLKGDDWQVMGFTMEILIKGNLSALYVNGRPVTA